MTALILAGVTVGGIAALYVAAMALVVVTHGIDAAIRGADRAIARLLRRH